MKIEDSSTSRNIEMKDFDKIETFFSTKYSFEDLIYDIFINKIENNYIWFYATYGNPNPCPKNLYDTSKDEYLDNSRTKNQVEMRNQLFALYDFQNKIFYCSNSKKKGFFENLLKKLLNLEIKIHNIYINIDEFEKRIAKLSSITFSSTDNFLTQNSKLKNTFKDYLNLDADIDFKIEINAKHGSFANFTNIFKRLKDAKNQLELENLSLVGKNDNEFEEVFNDGSFIKKFEQYFKENDEGLISSDDVQLYLINRIKNV